MRMWTLVSWIVVLTVGAVWAAEELKFGKDLSLETSVAIATLLEHPDDYVGKKVRVEGKVVGVCAKMGCWMEIVGEEPSKTIRAKVQDGVIVFPKEAVGRAAVVEGELQKVELDLDATIAYLRHDAEERGESFDAASVKEPKTIYQIWVHGAVVK